MSFGPTSPATTMNRQQELSQLEQVAVVLDQLEAHRIFLVTDAGAWNLSGAAERLSPSLAKHEVTIFADFEPNPKLPDVLRGMEAFQQAQVDVVLAVGGGSVIDTAKLINRTAYICKFFFICIMKIKLLGI